MTNISYNGYNTNVISMRADTAIEKNTPVTVDENGSCVAAAEDADFIGVAVNQRQDIVSVQTEGYVALPCADENLATGFVGLVGDGAGGVKVSANAAKKYRVLRIDVDEYDEDVPPIAGFIL